MTFRIASFVIVAGVLHAGPITFESPAYATASALSPVPANLQTNRPFDGQDGWSRSTSSSAGSIAATPSSGEYAGGQAVGGTTYIGAKSGYGLADPASGRFTFDLQWGSGEMGCGFWSDGDADGWFDQAEAQFQWGVVSAGGSLQFGMRHAGFGTRVGSGIGGTTGNWYRCEVVVGAPAAAGERSLVMRVRDLTRGEEIDFDAATAGIQGWARTVTSAEFGAAPGDGVFIRTSGGLIDNLTPGGALPDPGLPPDPPELPADARVVSTDGVWTWFNDNQAIVLPNGRHLVGYVKSDGNIAATSFDPVTGAGSEAILSGAGAVQVDDHNNPSFTVLEDGRVLAGYSRHDPDSWWFQRTSNVGDPRTGADWGAQRQGPTMPRGNSYSNAFRLADEGRIFHFSRSVNYNPTLCVSEDEGATWSAPEIFIKTGTGAARPYVRYSTDHRKRIDLIYTNAHPGTSPTSVWHLYYENGQIRRSDGSVIRSLASLPVLHDNPDLERGGLIYEYSTAAWGPGQGPDDWIPNGRAWTWDIHRDRSGAPVCVRSVQLANVTGTGFPHNRIYYYYARWDGRRWQKRFIAHAGSNLYAGEPNYAGGICIDPEDTRVVYLSTNAATPFALGSLTDVPLSASAKYELWRGFTADGGLTFQWTPVTRNSAASNLRPVVPENHGRDHTVLWCQGTYNSYTGFNTRVLGSFGGSTLGYAAWARRHGLPEDSWNDDADGDGRTNFLEYTTGADPASAADPATTRWRDGGFEFDAPDDRSDAECVVEHSENLTDWQAVAVVRNGGLPIEAAAGFQVIRNAGITGVIRAEGGPVPPRSGFFRLKTRLAPR